MKFTTEQAVELLRAAGVADAEIVAEGDTDYAQDAALQAIDGARSKILKPTWEHEKAEELLASSQGKAKGLLISKLVKLTGIKRSELDQLDKTDEIFDKAFSHLNSLKTGEAAEVEQKITEMLSQHNAAIEQLKSQHGTEVETWRNKYHDKETSNWLFGQLEKAPILDGANRMLAAGDLKSYLASKYHMVYDENEQTVKLFDKQNPTMPALNDTKTNAIDILGEAKSYFEPRGLWQTDMRNRNATDEMSKFTTDKAYIPNNGNSNQDPAASLMDSFKQMSGAA